MSQIKLSENFIKSNVKLALNEDLYPSGDITSDLIKNNETSLKVQFEVFSFPFGSFLEYALCILFCYK